MAEGSTTPSGAPIFVRALYDYQGADPSSLSFLQGEILEILSTLESGWWDGVALSSGARGWLPSNYVQPISEEEAQWAAGGDGARRGSAVSAAGILQGADAFASAGLVREFEGMGIARERSFSDLMATADEDLTSFSAGGDIFSEIAAAAQAESTGHSISNLSSVSLLQPNPSSNLRSLSSDELAASAAVASSFVDISTSSGSDSEEDFWVPKMTTSGRLFYFNTRSGETSRDMPIDGKGDGVKIDPSEFTVDEGGDTQHILPVSLSLAPPAVESDWKERPLADGRGSYYVNLRTGEQSWEAPTAAPRRASIAALANGTVTDAASEWTAREGEENRRSVDSEDSALDGVFADGKRREREASGSGSGTGGERSRKPVAVTADLLGPPPPPLISDLEEIAMRALQELSTAVGVVGRANRDFTAERERLAQIGDGVVHAVRLVLHSSGVLEHPVVSSSFAATISPANEIIGPFLHSSPLPPSAQTELRPYSRRLVSTLSKLTFSLRAMWGLLETTVEDQLVPEDDSPADPEELVRRSHARQQALAERRAVRDARAEHESRLRSEIMQGTRDVSDQVLAFLQHFQRVVASVSTAEGRPPVAFNQLRAPKSLQGSLRTNAAALLLPGGGFGGNWRGNGYVSLPTPHSSPNLSAANGDGPKTLAYTWPTKPISKEVVEELKKLSDGLVARAEELETAAVDGGNLEGLVDKTIAVQDDIAAFLVQVEEVDVAAGVDFQLPKVEESAASTRPASVATGTTASGVEESTASAKAYKASVLEARPLLAELEARKQALYDIAPRLLLALQNAALMPASLPISAGQPPANSPLAALPPPSVASRLPDYSSVRLVASDLSTAPASLCTTLTSLVAVAEIQATAPDTLRVHSLAFRTSLLYDPHSTSSGVPPSEGGHANAERMSITRSSQSHDSTFRSSYRSSADSDFFFSGAVPDHRRAALHQSSNGAGSSSTSLTNSQSGQNIINTVRTTSSSGRGAIPFGSVSGPSNGSGVETLSSSTNGPATGLPPGWDNRRRGSVITTTTNSSAGTISSPQLASVNESQSFSTLSPSRSSSKNIQKLLGELPETMDGHHESGKAWYLDRDWADEELSFTMENTIKGGTLRGLVIAATSHEGRVDSQYLSAFLMTYRTFCTSADLLDQLIDRYLVPEPEDVNGEQFKEWELKKLRPIRARVTNFLKAWVRDYMDHDTLDPILLQRIREFALNTMEEKGQSLQICKSVDERLQGAAPRTIGNLAPGALPTPIVPRNLKKFKLLDLEPLELARQLTIMDSRLFQRITPQECLSKAWPKEFGSEALNISAMIDMSNAVTRWVTECILAQEDLKKRAKIVQHFVTVAERCRDMNNFSTLIHIIAGLNSTPIHRLRRTWETVNQKSMISLGMLNNVMRPDKNYKEYRDILRKAAPPCVPFLGVYLTDWTFIGDGNADFLREKPHQINFHKRSKASELILQIKLHQATSFNLQQVPLVAKWLQEMLFPAQVHPDAETQLYNLSLALEPRERDDEKIARLLSESGFL